MTQDGVNLIYDYLHENYEYRDGRLLRIKSYNGWNIGHELGTFSFHDKWKTAQVKAVIKINKRSFSSTLAHFIWIYHNKKKPKFIGFKDGNPMNTELENLYELNSAQMYLKNTENSAQVFKIKNMNGIKYRALIVSNYESIFLGHYDSEEEAIEIYQLARKALSLSITSGVEIKKFINESFGFEKIKINKNKNGYKGVKKTKAGTYYGISTKKNQKILTPCFKSPQEAHEAYLKAKAELSTKIQPALLLGNIPVEKIQRAIDSMFPTTKEEVKSASEKIISKYRSALDNLADR